MIRTRASRIFVAVALFACAVCLLLVAQAESGTPHVSYDSFDPTVTQRLATAATLYAAGLVLLALAVLVSSSRTLIGVTAVLSLLPLGAGIWLGLSTDYLVWSGGALEVVPRSVTAVVLTAAAVVAVVVSALAFIRNPDLPPVARPHMPPPTHQA